MRPLSVVLLSSLLVALPTTISASVIKAPEAIAALGVDEYDATYVKHFGAIELRRDGHGVGTLAMRFSQESVLFARLAIDTRELEVEWHPSGGELTFSIDGVAYQPIRLDIASRKLVGDEAARSALHANKGLFALLAHLVDDVNRNYSSSSRLATLQPKATGDEIDVALPDWLSAALAGGGILNLDSDPNGCNSGCGAYQKRPVLACGGPWVNGESYPLSLTRSAMCEQARQDANNKCSNQYCWGCCRLLECDAICLAPGEDFFCLWAHVSGEQCSVYWQ